KRYTRCFLARDAKQSSSGDPGNNLSDEIFAFEVSQVISIILRKASRWIFFAALVYAPWAYGATTSASINITNFVLLVALVLWGAELLTARRRPHLSPFVLILTGGLGLVGGGMGPACE